MIDYVGYTNDKLIGWYENAKHYYGVIGSGKARIEGDIFIIDYVEDGVEKTWSYGYWGDEYGIEFYFNVWMEQG